jgi:hypothetical protein
MKAVLLLAFAAAAFGNNSAMEILHRTAETYRKSGKIEFNATIQKLENGGEKVSERSAVCRPGFDQIDQHVRSAEIAREERREEQGTVPAGNVSGGRNQARFRDRSLTVAALYQHIAFPSRARKQADSLSTEDGEVSGKSRTSSTRRSGKQTRRSKRRSI